MILQIGAYSVPFSTAFAVAGVAVAVAIVGLGWLVERVGSRALGERIGCFGLLFWLASSLTAFLMWVKE